MDFDKKILYDIVYIIYDWVHISSTQIRTKPKQISTAQNRATVARKVALTLQNYSEREDVCVEDISKDETYPIKRKKLEPRECSGQNITEKYAPSAERRRTIYYRESHSGRLVRKSLNFSWFFEEISSQASPETLSVTR